VADHDGDAAAPLQHSSALSVTFSRRTVPGDERPATNNNEQSTVNNNNNNNRIISISITIVEGLQ